MIPRLLSLLVAVGVFALAVPAYAHVTVSSTDAAPGGYGKIVVSVPDESATASTTKIELALPIVTPFASVLVQPKAGWTFKAQESTLPKPITTDDGDTVTSAITEITWTATAGGIKPGEFDLFTISVGPFPDVATMSFSAIQTYSDGEVVKWNETAAPGSTAEPEHPAPTLSLTRNDTITPLPAAPAAKSTQDKTARSLAVVALALAAAGLGVALVNRARAKGASDGL